MTKGTDIEKVLSADSTNVRATRFTNDATGHGMFVSVENVSSF